MASVRNIQRRPLQRTDSISLDTFLQAEQSFKYQTELEKLNDMNHKMKVEDLNHKILLAKRAKEQLEKEYSELKSIKESIDVEVKADSEIYKFTLNISHFQLQIMNNTSTIIENYNKNPVSILKLCSIQMCLPSSIRDALKTYTTVIETNKSKQTLRAINEREKRLNSIKRRIKSTNDMLLKTMNKLAAKKLQIHCLFKNDEDASLKAAYMHQIDEKMEKLIEIHHTLAFDSFFN